MVWVGKDHLAPISLSWAGNFPLDQVTQNPIQIGMPLNRNKSLPINVFNLYLLLSTSVCTVTCEYLCWGEKKNLFKQSAKSCH